MSNDKKNVGITFKAKEDLLAALKKASNKSHLSVRRR